MDVIYLKLIKIDHDNNSVTEEPLGEEGNVRAYVMSIIDFINDKADREYKFKEGELTMKTYVERIVNNDDRDATSLLIANRLLDKENQAQIRYRNITDIQKGILLVAFCKMTDIEHKVVISKADYTEFIEEATGQKRNGLPTKKKIFKSFSANISKNADSYTIGKMVTFDVNSNQAKYWYDEFLDLKALLDDVENTKRAFNNIRSRVLDKIAKTHKNDHLHIWNMTIGYLRSEGEFSIDYLADNIIAPYHPVDADLDMNDLAARIKELPDKCGFDKRFAKVPSEIHARTKLEYELTSDIKLVLNKNIQDLDNTIKAHQDDEGNKYIMIRSESGYNLVNTERHEN